MSEGFQQAIFRVDFAVKIDGACTDPDAGEQFAGVIVSYVDATEHRALEEDLEKARRELETAYEELQSTVEELETTNEELQSTNAVKAGHDAAERSLAGGR